jgi:hypothetical protein
MAKLFANLWKICFALGRVGHRLSSGSNMSASGFNGLSTVERIILKIVFRRVTSQPTGRPE